MVDIQQLTFRRWGSMGIQANFGVIPRCYAHRYRRFIIFCSVLRHFKRRHGVSSLQRLVAVVHCARRKTCCRRGRRGAGAPGDKVRTSGCSHAPTPPPRTRHARAASQCRTGAQHNGPCRDIGRFENPSYREPGPLVNTVPGSPVVLVFEVAYY